MLFTSIHHRIFNQFITLSFLLSFAPLFAAAQAPGQLPKIPKAEDIVERAILFYGSRPVMAAIQKNGRLRANVKFHTADGVREGKTLTQFIRKPKLGEDLLMLDLELPGTRYLLGYDGKATWSVNNGEAQEPNADTVKAFHSAHEHSYEALLRYKENDGKLELTGGNKLGTLDLDVVGMTLPSGAKTRYEISRRTGRVIYLYYEEKPSADAAPVKYKLYFKDFRLIQNTYLPYITQVYADDKLIEERTVVEVAYNVQMEEKIFLAENANKPVTEATIK